MPLADEQGDAAPPVPTSDMRALAREIFLDTLDECSVPAAFQRNVEYDHGVLRIGEDLYNLDSYSRVFVVAIGKAAHTMTDALVAQVGGRVEGVVVAPTEPTHYLHRFTYFKGGHPLPTQESVAAARHILRELQHLNEFALVVFLISGGGSALAESPLYESISLEDLVQTYQTLVHSGAPIRGDQCDSQASFVAEGRTDGGGGGSRAPGFRPDLGCSGECAGLACLWPNDARLEHHRRLLSDRGEVWLD